MKKPLTIKQAESLLKDALVKLEEMHFKSTVKFGFAGHEYWKKSDISPDNLCLGLFQDAVQEGVPLRMLSIFQRTSEYSDGGVMFTKNIGFKKSAYILECRLPGAGIFIAQAGPSLVKITPCMTKESKVMEIQDALENLYRAASGLMDLLIEEKNARIRPALVR